MPTKRLSREELWRRGDDLYDNYIRPRCIDKQVFTNKDGSTGVVYLVTRDIALTAEQITTLS